MKLLSKGAEAEIFEENFLGEKAVLKKRVPKKYRVKELDAKIISERTKQECNLIAAAKKAGVRTPVIFYANKKTGEIVLEKIEGKKAKDMSPKKIEQACVFIGRDVARLHEAGIIHGDLTTGNIFLKGKKVIFVDFGLGFFSQKIEDRAVDLLVLKKILFGAHSSAEHAWEKVLEGYRKKSAKAGEVISRIAEIEKRTRYS